MLGQRLAKFTPPTTTVFRKVGREQRRVQVTNSARVLRGFITKNLAILRAPDADLSIDERATVSMAVCKARQVMVFYEQIMLL